MLRFNIYLLLMIAFAAGDPFNVSEFPSHNGEQAVCKPLKIMVTNFTLPCKNTDFKVLVTPSHFSTVLAGDEQMTTYTKIANYSASGWFLNNRTFLREVDYVLKMKENVNLQEIQVMRNFSDGFSLATYGVFTSANSTFVLEHKLCGKETDYGFELTFMQEFTFTHDPLFLSVERYLTNLVYQLAGLMDEQCRSHRINVTALSINMSTNSSPIFDDIFISGDGIVEAIADDGKIVPARSVAKQYVYLTSWEARNNETDISFTFVTLYKIDNYTVAVAFIGISLLLLLTLSICCCSLACCKKKQAVGPQDERDLHPEISSPMPFRHPAIAYV